MFALCVVRGRTLLSPWALCGGAAHQGFALLLVGLYGCIFAAAFNFSRRRSSGGMFFLRRWRWPFP